MPLLSKVFSRSREAKEKEALEEATASNEHHSPPPSYAAAKDEDYASPPADLTSGFAKLKLDSTSEAVPRPQECIAHLKLLECFYRLKQQIGSAEGLFGISDPFMNPDVRRRQGDEEELNKIRAVVSEKRWQVYVSRAVHRFEAWRKSLQPRHDWLTITDATCDEFTGGKIASMVKPAAGTQAILFTPNNVPPIGQY